MVTNKHSSRRAVIVIMIALSAVVIIVSYFYYGEKNNQVDPRIIEAREMYAGYNEIAAQNDYKRAFSLLDSIDFIYLATAHYKNSFERGVLKNNKAAALITMVMIKDSTPVSKFPVPYQGLKKDSLLTLAAIEVSHSIELYENWFLQFKDTSTEEISQAIEAEFLVGLEGYSTEEQQGFLNNRIDEIETAMREKDRRMSVSLTNLGMIYRHQERYNEAIESYQKAVELWPDNLTAKNNINVLLRRPLEKKSPLRKIFPKDKEEDL